MEKVLNTFNKLTIIDDRNKAKLQMNLIKAFRHCNDPENLAIIYERFLDSDSPNDRADIRFLEMGSKPIHIICEMKYLYRRNKGINIFNS